MQHKSVIRQIECSCGRRRLRRPSLAAEEERRDTRLINRTTLRASQVANGGYSNGERTFVRPADHVTETFSSWLTTVTDHRRTLLLKGLSGLY